MDYSTIRYDVADGIATITLSRPEKMNAFTNRMMAEMIDAFDAIDADDAIRAVIVTGEGRAFCAGADLTPDGGGGPFSSDDPVTDLSDARVRDGGGLLTLRMFQCKKPVIGAINGAAVGIGVTMQLPMDMRLASTSARFGFVFARRGIVPEAASSWFLPRLVGQQQALEWCMTGRVFGADEALAGGLVRSVHSPEELMPAAIALARGDHRQYSAGFSRSDPGDAVAHPVRAAPDACAPCRQPCHLHALAVGRCSRGHIEFPREACCGLSRPGCIGHAGILSMVG